MRNPRRSARYKHDLAPRARKDADRWAVRYFEERYDPYWRAVLIENLLRLMRDRAAAGAAAADATGLGWLGEDQYVHGNLARGLTAAGVNELAMHCEDLFSLIRAGHEDRGFAIGALDYDAGKAAALAARIAAAPEGWIRQALLVPDATTLAAGLVEAPDPQVAVAAAEAGAARIVDWCREAAQWYIRNESSHIRYKHGMRLLIGGFGPLSQEQIEKRRTSTRAALISLTNKPIKDGASGLMFEVADRLRPHLAALYERRLLLRVEIAGAELDLVDLAALAWRVAAVQACVLANRAALDDMEGQPDEQVVTLPHEQTRLSQTVRLRLSARPDLDALRLRL
jgi:hypothetical protein